MRQIAIQYSNRYIKEIAIQYAKIITVAFGIEDFQNVINFLSTTFTKKKKK